MTPATNGQSAERAALKLQWKQAVRSLQLAVSMTERTGVDGAELEVLQVIELAQRVARQSTRKPGAAS